MSDVPAIAIVGRPNVGKSSYFNSLVGERVSIVEDTPGVTRDRVIERVQIDDRLFDLIDTGGIGVNDEMRLDDDIEHQIDVALQTADGILFLVDGKEGLTPLDTRVAEILRKLRKPMVLGVNKLDHPNKFDLAHEFWGLGIGDPHPVSTKEVIGVRALMGLLLDEIPENRGGEQDDDRAGLPRIAFIGKRNAGKSTLLNTLVGTDRVIVSEIAGTTRDAVDVTVEYAGRRFVAVDTAGMMRKSSIDSSIEYYSQTRAEAALRRADIIVHMTDASSAVSRVDKKIETQVLESFKPIIIVVNKWDLARDETETSKYEDYIAKKLPGLHFAPIVFISATEAFNIDGLLDVAFDLFKQAGTRVSTGELNRVLEQAFQKRRPAGHHGYRARMFYGTQTGVHPPTFAIFVNESDLFGDEYQRYVQGRIRAAFDFEEIPVRVDFRRRKSLYHD